LIKTVTCQGGKALATTETIAFVGLHLGIIGLMAGGLFTTGGRMSGYIVLTEGQPFKDVHDGYVSLTEGPLRKEQHTSLSATLRKVETQYTQGRQTHFAAQLDVFSDEGTVTKQVEINRPVTWGKLTFTLDEVGYSPRLQIKREDNPRILSDRFVALKNFKTDRGTFHRDYLPLPFFNNRVYATLYPSRIHKADEVVKKGNQPESPLLIIEIEDDSGKIVETADMPLGGKVTVGGYTFGFGELRRWASFRVSDDPGYPIVCVALWLGLVALVLRYVPDLRKWFLADGDLQEKD
jgi:cytochrome c biogenesis protein ResB